MAEKIETTKMMLAGREIPLLSAEQIDCRVGQTAKDNSWFTILLYKDARCDMAVLDSIVGPTNWQRDHKEIKGNLYCGVGIFTGSEWVWKWDCGTESNTEAEKGEASDSFKRACVNWGIGRELYTAPQIFIKPEAADIRNGKIAARLEVASITYNENREITGLVLRDTKTKAVRYTFGQPAPRPAAPKAAPQGLKKGQTITREMVEQGACNALIANLRIYVGKPEYQAKAAAMQSFYKWDSIETYNTICRKACEA